MRDEAEGPWPAIDGWSPAPVADPAERIARAFFIVGGNLCIAMMAWMPISVRYRWENAADLAKDNGPGGAMILIGEWLLQSMLFGWCVLCTVVSLVCYWRRAAAWRLTGVGICVTVTTVSVAFLSGSERACVAAMACWPVAIVTSCLPATLWRRLVPPWR